MNNRPKDGDGVKRMNVKMMSFFAIGFLVLRQLLLTARLDSSFILPFRETSVNETVKPNNNNIRLIHVMNAYSINPNKDVSSGKATPVSPFDQWSAIESIQRAKRYAPPQLDIDFVCAMFEEDRVALPDIPCRTVLLTRSTASEFPFLNTANKTAKVLPFLQDILDAALQGEDEAASNGESRVFVMLTNSDIGVTKYFYQTIWPQLKTREAFSVNRLTIPTDGINETALALQRDGDELLSQVDALLDQGESHPGYDCFIMHSSVLKRFHLGLMFAGHPPWGTAVHYTLRIMARNYTNFPSNTNGTFHLGNDQSNWLPKGGKQQQEQFLEIQKQKTMMNECPIQPFGNHPYTVLNTINCGKWFRYNRLFNNHTIPSFVQEGYEKLYLQNYPKVLHYSLPNGLGLPSVGSKAAFEKRAAETKAAALAKKKATVLVKTPIKTNATKLALAKPDGGKAG